MTSVAVSENCSGKRVSQRLGISLNTSCALTSSLAKIRTGYPSKKTISYQHDFSSGALKLFSELEKFHHTQFVWGAAEVAKVSHLPKVKQAVGISRDQNKPPAGIHLAGAGSIQSWVLWSSGRRGDPPN